MPAPGLIRQQEKQPVFVWTPGLRFSLTRSWTRSYLMIHPSALAANLSLFNDVRAETEMLAITVWPGLKSRLKHKVNTRLWGRRDRGIERLMGSPVHTAVGTAKRDTACGLGGRKIKYRGYKVYPADFPLMFCPFLWGKLGEWMGDFKMRISSADLQVLHGGKDFSVKQLSHKMFTSTPSCSCVFPRDWTSWRWGPCHLATSFSGLC